MKGSVRFSTRTLQATTTPAAASWPSSFGSADMPSGAASSAAPTRAISTAPPRMPFVSVLKGRNSSPATRTPARMASPPRLGVGNSCSERSRGWSIAPTRWASFAASGVSRTVTAPATRNAQSASRPFIRAHTTPDPGRDFRLWRGLQLAVPPSDVRGENCMTPNRPGPLGPGPVRRRSGRRVLRARRLRGEEEEKDTDPTLKVMTRNIYLGGNIFLPIGAPDRATFESKTQELWNQIQFTNFPARAKLLANEVKRTKPGPDRPAGGGHLAPQPRRGQGRLGHALAAGGLRLPEDAERRAQGQGPEVPHGHLPAGGRHRGAHAAVRRAPDHA